jgi:aminoglycoside phosphotransferase (APT) family kinase protein
VLRHDDLERARAVVHAHYPGAEAKLEPIAGSKHALLRIALPDGARILKLAAAGGDDAIRKEHALIARLAGGAVPVPAIEHADVEGRRVGRAYLLMASAGERTVLDWAREPGPLPRLLFTEMGTVLARIHEVALPAPGDIRHDGIVPADARALLASLSDWAAWLVGQGLLGGDDAELLATLPIPATDGTALCHGDFHAVQCVVGEGRIAAVVDWEAAWSGNPWVDLAFAHAYLDFYCVSQQGNALVRALELQRCFFDGYGARRPLPPDYQWEYLPVRMAHALGVLRAWHGWGPRAWQAALAQGRVAQVLALYRAYGRRVRERRAAER